MRAEVADTFEGVESQVYYPCPTLKHGHRTLASARKCKRCRGRGGARVVETFLPPPGRMTPASLDGLNIEAQKALVADNDTVIPDEVMVALARDAHWSVWDDGLWRRSDLPGEALVALWNRNWSNRFPIALAAIRSIHAPGWLLEEALKFDYLSDSALVTLAKHQNSPAGVLARVSRSEHHEAAAAAAANPHIDEQALRLLAVDRMASVRQGVALNPMCPVDVFEALEAEQNVDVDDGLLRNASTPNHLAERALGRILGSVPERLRAELLTTKLLRRAREILRSSENAADVEYELSQVQEEFRARVRSHCGPLSDDAADAISELEWESLGPDSAEVQGAIAIFGRY